jgi:hypothetical protein
LFDECEELLHFAGAADERAEDAGVAEFAAGAVEFLLGVALTSGVGERGAEAGGVDGLLHEVVGAELNGFDGAFDGALRGDDDDGAGGAGFAEAMEEFHAVHARHFHVSDDERGGPGLDFFEGLEAVFRDFSAVAPAGDEFGEAETRVEFVLDDEDFAACCSGGGRAQGECLLSSW